MDGAGKGYKLFPGYTLAELKDFAAEGVTATRDAARLEMIKQEIKDRESGESKQLKTPQAKWGKDSEDRKDANPPRMVKTKDGKEVDVANMKKVDGGWEGYVVNAQGHAVKTFVPEKERNDSDEMTMQQRLDTMAQQVNALGQVAAKVAGRIDARETIPGTKAIGERLGNGENEFVQLIATSGEMSNAEAWRAFEKMKKLKVVKRDFASGRWSVIHGAYWERDVLRRAAGLE